MTYDDIKLLRSAILEEIQEQFFGLPLTVEHYKLCEMRVQTVAMLFNKDSLVGDINSIFSEIESVNEKDKDERMKKYG